MRKIWKTVLGCAVGSLSAMPSANASLLYSTNFNSPTYSDGALILPPIATDTTTAGQDGWLNTNAGLTNNILVSNTATNGRVSLTTSGQDVRHLFDGGAAVTSGSVYFEADITVSAAQAAGDYALHLSDGGVSNFYARTYFKSSGNGYVMALGTGAGTATYGTTVLDFGTTYHILSRYDFVPGAANDTGALYINPTTEAGLGDTPYVAATTIGTEATSIAAVAFRQGTAGNAATLTVDNVEVHAVPEPASIALLGLAAIGLLRRRNRD